VDLDKDKLVFLFLYNEYIFKKVVDLLSGDITMNTSIKSHHYILFTMEIHDVKHGLRFIL